MKGLEDFKQSLTQPQPPAPLSGVLKALWWDAKDNWDKAHSLAQDDAGSDGAWVHAYLHRKEGDLGNAGYWYSRAGRGPSRLSLEEEWEEIVTALLNR